MNHVRFENRLSGGVLAAVAAIALTGCATSKQHSASLGCNDCESRWVAVEKLSTVAVASTDSHFGSVVSPIGDAPGERDLAYARTWQWERQHFCGVNGSDGSAATASAR
jgi:hypothetical protein